MTTPDKQMPPGPRGIKLLSAVRALQKDSLSTMIQLRQEYGDVVSLPVGAFTIYFVHDPELMQHVLQGNNRNYRKGRFNEPLKPLLGQGLLTNEGESWLHQRRLLQPAFHRRVLATFVELMNEAAERVAQRWETFADNGEPVDVAAEMDRLTLDIVGRALFSTDTETIAAAIAQTLTPVVQEINYRSQHPGAPPLWVPTRRNRRYRDNEQALKQIISDLIASRRQHPARPDHPDLLDLLLEAEDADTAEKMTDQQILDEVLTFIVAGHETTANALTFGWYLLAQHPEVEAQLQQELDDVLAGRPATLEDLPQLPYNLMVFEETLRLYPPSVILPRQANEADQIGPYHVPADTIVLISQYVVHRHPDLWPEPDRFDPERFRPDAARSRHRYSYLPFGDGPRVCIGKPFALLEAQLITARLVQRFTLRPVEVQSQLDAEVAVTLRPRHGLPMFVRRR